MTIENGFAVARTVSPLWMTVGVSWRGAHGLLAVIAGLAPVGVGRHSSAGQSMPEASAVAGMGPRAQSGGDRGVTRWRSAINAKQTVIAGLDRAIHARRTFGCRHAA